MTTPDPTQIDRLAFEATADERSRTALEDVPEYSLDAFFACGRALAIVPRVDPFRAALRTLPGFDLPKVDRMSDFARGLRFAHTVLLRRTDRPRTTVDPLEAAEADALRRTMLKYCDALSDSGRIDPAFVARVRAGTGYPDLVEDLNVLVQELLALPPAFTGPESAVPRDRIERASELAHRINVSLGKDLDLDLSKAALFAERRKLAGLLLASHGELLRGMTYLRWKERDAAQLVPTLYKTGKRAPTPEESPPPDLAKLHEELHSLTQTPHAEDAAVHPDDNPFTE